MHIIFVTFDYPTRKYWGGVGVYYKTLATALKDKGHNISIIIPGEISGKINKDGITIYKVKNRYAFDYDFQKIKFYRPVFKLIFSFKIYNLLKKIIKKQPIHLVVCPEGGYICFFTVFDKRFKVITQLHTPGYLYDRITNRYGFLNFLAPLLTFAEKIQTKKSKSVTCASFILAEKVSHKWRIDLDTIKIIRNGIDLESINKNSKNINNYVKGQKYILFSGHLEKLKGIFVLSEAMKRVFSKKSDIKLVMVGRKTKDTNSKIWRNFINRYQNRIIILDHMPHAELIPVIKDALCVVVPSLWESFGIICLEAMALGKIVIGSKKTGMQEIIDDNINGFLIEPGSPNILAKKILRILNNPDNLRIESMAKLKVEQHFDIKKIVEETEKYFREII